ncbi:MAG TPA: UbiA family prenyltransferase [Thermoanaerobaculia bacterium]|nr:UbiA family prenyltransferase [Thermoanaerobaculia bacterium]
MSTLIEEGSRTETRRRRSVLRALLLEIRPHQWLKNALLILPLFLAHRLSDLDRLTDVALAFVAFSLGASAGYVINDLIDLEADRRHPVKRHRMIATGEVSRTAAIVLIAVLGVAALAVAVLVSPAVAGWLAAYAVISLTYSLFFKRAVVADLVILASLYTLRILAGGSAARVEVSDWLLAFSLFFFFNLAVVKRCADLRRTELAPGERLPGRPYSAADYPLLQAAGVASGLVSVVVLALYLNGDRVRLLYSRPELLWLVSPILLYWIVRAWLLTSRGEVADDPILFAVKDPVSLLTAALVAVLLVVAV